MGLMISLCDHDVQHNTHGILAVVATDKFMLEMYAGNLHSRGLAEKFLP